MVIGFFDFHASPQPPGYDQFYYASMRSIELGKSAAIQLLIDWVAFIVGLHVVLPNGVGQIHVNP